jgi:hypothetical protein
LFSKFFFPIAAKVTHDLSALFVWLISHQPAVLFSQNKSAISNQPAVLFSQNKSAPAISYQPNEHAPCWCFLEVISFLSNVFPRIFF